MTYNKKTKKNISFYSYNSGVFYQLGLNVNQPHFLLKQKHISVLNKQALLQNKEKQRTLEFLSFNSNLKNYKNFRNILGYPCRGQRTHTNAKTKKKHKIQIQKI